MVLKIMKKAELMCAYMLIGLRITDFADVQELVVMLKSIQTKCVELQNSRPCCIRRCKKAMIHKRGSSTLNALTADKSGG